VEQRIDPKTQSEHAVGTDPAYVPGLVSSRPDGTEGTEQEPEQTEGRRPAAAVPQDAVPHDGAEDVRPQDGPEDEPPPEAEAASVTAEPGEGGPVFEAADRRGAITADREGIRFRLDDEEAEFLWDEIGAVEVSPARFGRLFTVTVHVAANRWFNADVEASARGRLKEWTAELDAVLDAYFEEA
jgi:hypothetical protein